MTGMTTQTNPVVVEVMLPDAIAKEIANLYRLIPSIATTSIQQAQQAEDALQPFLISSGPHSIQLLAQLRPVIASAVAHLVPQTRPQYWSQFKHPDTLAAQKRYESDNLTQLTFAIDDLLREAGDPR